jgi:hypothetical protein
MDVKEYLERSIRQASRKKSYWWLELSKETRTWNTKGVARCIEQIKYYELLESQCQQSLRKGVGLNLND